MLGGCSGMKSYEPQQEFTSTVIVRSQRFATEEFLLEAEVQRSSGGELDIVITSPKEISGLLYSYSDKFYMSYNDLYCETETDYLPVFSFPQVIRNVLDDFYTNAECTDKSTEGCTYKGKSKSGEYILCTDKDGYIKNVSIEGINFSADFINNR